MLKISGGIPFLERKLPKVILKNRAETNQHLSLYLSLYGSDWNFSLSFPYILVEVKSQ